MKNIRKYIAIFTALSIAGVAAFFSVSGIAKLFAGSSMAVMIMAAVLEVGKIITASLLERHWNELKTSLKIYLSIGVLVLMTITSVGIYGFLSSAYQETAYKVENINKQVSVLDIKRVNFEGQINRISLDLENIDKQIGETEKQISNANSGLSNNFIQTKDKNGNIITTTSSANRKVFQENLKTYENKRKEIELRRENLILKQSSLNDSISMIDMKKLEVETNSDLAGEVSSLKYLSDLTGQPMNKIVNWFILMLIFVFDPLAITLLIAAQSISSKKENEKKEETFKESNNQRQNQEQNVSDEEDLGNEESSKTEKNISQDTKENNLEDFEKYYQEQLDNITKYKSKFIDLIDVLYEDGKVKKGENLLNYLEFKSKVDALFVNKFSGDDIKRFLTICNYLKITSLNDGERKALMDFEDAKKTLENYLEK
jgi:hypothetical protein